MTRVRWVVAASRGVPAEEFVLDLDEPTYEHYRSYYERIKDMPPGPERSALISELRVQMDMVALLDARIVPPEPPPPKIVPPPVAPRLFSDLDALPDFDGVTYNRALDHARLGKQLGRVARLMGDGRWHTLAEIEGVTRDPQASISARLRDLRKKKFGGHAVNRERLLDGGGQFRYRLVLEKHAQPWGDEDDEDDEEPPGDSGEKLF